MSRASSKTGRAFLVNLGISLVVTTLVLLLTQDILTEFPPLRRIENSFIDLRFQRRGAIDNAHDSSRIVIVEISQESFKSLPAPWPWPRSYYTRLIRNLKRAGAKAIGIDLVFSSSDLRNPGEDEEFRKTLRETGIVALA
jgi:adenylate cyclase